MIGLCDGCMGLVTRQIPVAVEAKLGEQRRFVLWWDQLKHGGEANPRRKVRFPEKDEANRFLDFRAGDPVPSGDNYGMFPDIPRREYRSARASLSRALTRLNKRGLTDFVWGNGYYSGGPVLTPAGEKIARLLAYPTVRRIAVS